MTPDVPYPLCKKLFAIAEIAQFETHYFKCSDPLIPPGLQTTNPTIIHIHNGFQFDIDVVALCFAEGFQAFGNFIPI